MYYLFIDMLYQLPSGETIEISTEEYFALSDYEFDIYIRQGRYTNITNVQLDHSEYRSGTSGQNYDFSVLEDDEVEVHDNRTLNQIIDSMSEDE